MIAGEASGDLHGASLINEIKKIDNTVKFIGIGGNLMKNAGMEIIFHINQMAFLGFVEVIKHYPFIRQVRQKLIATIIKEKITDVILIDYPGFNLNFAKHIKNLGTRVFYYISPQIWAWGQKRVFKVKKVVHKMIVLFPFEEKFYKKYDVDASYVGHPLIDEIGEYPFISKNELYEKYNLDKNKEILLILPGSRQQEINLLLNETLNAAKVICEKFNLQPVVACSPNISSSTFNSYLKSFDFTLIKSHTYDLYKYSFFGIIKSGTSTLEAGLLQLPHIIVYKTNKLTYYIGRMLVKIKNIGLVNIVAEKNIIQELIQADVTSENIIKTVESIIEEPDRLNNIKNSLELIREKLGNPGAAKRAALIITKELNAD